MPCHAMPCTASARSISCNGYLCIQIRVDVVSARLDEGEDTSGLDCMVAERLASGTRQARARSRDRQSTHTHTHTPDR